MRLSRRACVWIKQKYESENINVATYGCHNRGTPHLVCLSSLH